MKYDEVLQLIGEMGPYQVKILILVALTNIPEAMNSMIAVFITASLDSWCAVPEWSEAARTCTELSPRSPEYLECIHRYRDASIPVTDNVDGEAVYAKCYMYDAEYPVEFEEGFFAGDLANSTRTCQDGWTYDHSRYKSTIASDFDLVCDQKHLPMVTQSVFYFGYLFGAFAAGSLADIIGRYKTIFICVTLDLVAGVALVLSPNIWFFFVFRFLVGVGNLSLYITAFVIVLRLVAGGIFRVGVGNLSLYLTDYAIATELLGPSKRSIGGVSSPLTFGVGSCILALLAFFIRDWRHLQLVVSAFLVPIYLLIPILPESARWLMAHKKYDETEVIIAKIAKNNGTLDKIPPDLIEGLRKEQEEVNAQKVYTIIDVFRQPRLRSRAIILFLVWPVISMVYFGLSLNPTKFGSDPYVTFFISGFVEIPANLLIIPLIGSPLGRRYTLLGAMLLAGGACFITIFATGAFKTAVAMTGKFAVTIAFSAIYIFTAEIYPTTVRSIGVGASSTVARVGSICAPITLLMADWWEPLPLVIYATLTIIAGTLLFVSMPETRGKVLTATLEEAEEFLRTSGSHSRMEDEDTQI